MILPTVVELSKVVCFKQVKSYLSTEKRYVIYSIYGSACFVSWGKSALRLFYL